MKCFGFAILLVHITNACIEPGATTVHIQNYEGPIYVSPGDNHLTTSNQASHCDRYPATTSQLPHCDNHCPATPCLAPHCDNCYPATTNQAPHCNNHCPATPCLAPHCDNCYPASTSQAPHCDNHCPATPCLAPHCDNCYPASTSQAPHCDNRYPTLCNYDNQPNILHNSVPYHQTICEADCKCLTKHQSFVPVAVNSVPQNTCTPGYYSSQYPEGCNGYLCPDTNCPETDLSIPRISETLIPLLKTYLSQVGSCPKHTCQCGRKYSHYT